MPTEIVEIEGHIIDSLMLAKVLDLVLAAGAEYRMMDVEIGHDQPPTRAGRGSSSPPSDDAALEQLLDELQVHGANRVDSSDADPRARRRPTACFPPASTPPPTCRPRADRRAPGTRWATRRWTAASSLGPTATARTVPMHRVRAGDQVVVGHRRRTRRGPRGRAGAELFEFMGSEVSSEKPKALLVAESRRAHPRRREQSGRQGARRLRARRRPHRCRPRRRRGSCATGGSTSSSPATASPPTTSSRTCSAPRSACRCGRGRRPRAATQPPAGHQRDPPARLDRRRRRGRLPPQRA